MTNRQKEIMEFQKAIFNIFDNNLISERDKDLLRPVLWLVTRESIDISRIHWKNTSSQAMVRIMTV